MTTENKKTYSGACGQVISIETDEETDTIIITRITPPEESVDGEKKQ